MAAKNFQVLEPAMVAGAGDVIVSFVGWHEIHYADLDRVIVFSREPLFEGENTIAYEVSPPIEWQLEPPHDVVSVPENQRATILCDVRAALAALGLKGVFPGEPL